MGSINWSIGLRPSKLEDVYGLDSKVITDPTSDAPMVIPIGKHNKELEADL